VKSWPVALALWLVGQRRWEALAWTAGSLAICALISLAGAGWDNHVAYLGVAAGIHPSAFSLTWQLGVPWLWAAVLVLGLVLIVVVRSRPDWSYRLAILTMILGTPVVNPNTYAILLAAISPQSGRPALRPRRFSSRRRPSGARSARRDPRFAP